MDGKLPMSKRLLMNAALVPKCSVFADIGCDHAYTCLYLVSDGTVGHALAMDVKGGPLLRAEENIKRHGLKGRVKTRLSDGLAGLKAGEADCILISGMGGPLMVDILKKGWEKVLASKWIVLQPQSEIGQVREFLHKMGWLITAEDMCEEDGKFYTAMRAESAGGTELAGDIWDTLPREAVFCYGARLIEEKHPVLKEYLRRELIKKQEVVRQLDGQGSERTKERMCELHKECRRIREVLSFLSR
ncbi:MAG: class I SAM-dependent methyltransferase [Lachnospiraceae bacterium]|nr:class I SAM-dependent methyltransferase [Lachnospiraceae bacterium]